MESRNTADAGPFTLGDLCALMALDPPQLAAFLAPLRDLREDGIYPRQLSERDTEMALDSPVALIGAAPGWEDAPIRLSKFGYAVADLPFPFRWSELLDFFDVEGDAAWEVERKLTNDPGREDLRPPIDAVAFCRLEARSPALAALVRPLLETGAGDRWWRVASEVSAGDAAEMRPIQRESSQTMADNERRVRLEIERELKARGITAVPAFKRGKDPDKFKAQVQAHSGLTDGAFKHAWGAVTKGMRPLKRLQTD